jgi:hypothetical protein
MRARLSRLCPPTFFFACVLATATVAAADEVPTVLHYQGRFADPAGTPLAGPVALIFRVYSNPAGGAALWSETHPEVPLNEGVGSVLLGSLTPFPATIFSGTGRYLEIAVDDEILTPRLVLASVPFALEAARLGGLNASAFESAGAAADLADSLAASDASPPNQGGNRVHWDNLAGVPEGFADGIDNAFGSGSDDLTGANIMDSTLTGADVAARSLAGRHLQAGGVTGVEVALESLTGDHILDDGIRSADILDGTVSSADLAPGAVGTEALAADAVTSSKIADGSIQISDVAFVAGDVTGVTAGSGLVGGGPTGEVTLAVGAGTGISVTASSVSLAPSYISGSAYDGRFVPSANPTWTPVSGAVSVSASSFRQAAPVGKFTINAPTGSSVSDPGGYLYVDTVDNVGAENDFLAPIQLPHGGQITSFWISYYDNSPGSLKVSLYRTRNNGSGRTEVASVTTAGQAAVWSSANDAVITEIAIDNVEFTYWLQATFPNTPQGSGLRLLAARVHYTVSRPY